MLWMWNPYTVFSPVASAATLRQTPHPAVAGQTPQFSDTVLLTASQLSKWSLRLVFVTVIARAMGPVEFGSYALIFAMVEFLAVASGAAYADYLTREAATGERAAWALALQLMLLRVAIAIPAAAIEIGILSIMRYPHAVLSGTAWMAMTMLPRSLSEAVQGVLRGVHRFCSVLAIELTLGTGLVAGAVILFLRHGGLSMAVATELAAAAAAGVVGLAFLLRFKTQEQTWLSGWQVVKRGLIFNIYSFVVNLYDRFDVVLLSKLSGDYSTGIYAVAYRAVSMTQILPHAVLYSLLPTLSRNPQGEEERARLKKAMGLLLSVGFVVVLATMVFATPVVGLVLGPQYVESALALKILIWAVILRYVNCALNFALLASGRERVFVTTSLVCLAVNFVGNVVFIPLYSWRAAAILTIATEAVLLAQNVYWIRHTLGNMEMPIGAVRSAAGFLTLLAVVEVGGRWVSPFLIGSACLLIFIGYLLLSGLANKFAGVWEQQGDAAA